MNQDLFKKYSELKKVLKKYDNKYRGGSPLIEDDYYDQLNSELKKIEDQIGIKKTNKINDLLNGVKVKHTAPILSLDHGFEDAAIVNFVNRMGPYAFPLIVEHKIDGVSLSIRYRNGEINQILTRGNGREGIDVTHKLTGLNIPQKIEYIGDFEIRGELYTTFAEFENIKDQFSSPRNYCASLLHKKSIESRIKVFFAAHDCLTFNDSDYLDTLNHLKQLGFPIVWNRVTLNIEQAIGLFWENINNRAQIEYPIDGIVLKINDSKYRNELGSHLTAPRYATAIKARTKRKITTIKKIVFSVGKFGNITPVAIIEPLNISGCVINKVSIHNIEEINRNNYGEGDIIEVERTGEAVPQIVKKVFSANNITKIEKCPSCGTSLIKTKETVRCNNSWNCLDQKVGRISHFCSRNAMNIEGLSEKRILQLVLNDLISFPTDLFRLTSANLIQLEGWSHKSISNLLENLKQVKTKNLENILFALCIPNIGYGKAMQITKHCDSFNSFLEKFKQSLFINLPNIGKVAGESIFDFLNGPDYFWIKDLMYYLKH